MIPEVSVIVPSYNHARYLHQRLESILNQEYQNFELIILDDCSTDNSRTIIEQYAGHPRVSMISFNATNSGSPFFQWEKGLLLARGNWIWIAESDDFASPLFLGSLMNLVSVSPDAGIAFSNSFWVDAEGRAGESLSTYKHSFYRTGSEEIRSRLFRNCTIQNVSAALIQKKHAVSAIKGLGKYKACGDWIFYIRILQHTGLVFTSERLNSFRWYHPDSISAKARDQLWISEGIDLLKNIDYHKSEITGLGFLKILLIWFYRIRLLKNFQDKRKAHSTLFYAALICLRLKSPEGRYS